MAVSKVSAIARPIPTVASLSAMCPLLVRQIDVAHVGLWRELNGKMCELLHTSLVVQKMQSDFSISSRRLRIRGSLDTPAGGGGGNAGFCAHAQALVKQAIESRSAAMTASTPR